MLYLLHKINEQNTFTGIKAKPFQILTQIFQYDSHFFPPIDSPRAYEVQVSRVGKNSFIYPLKYRHWQLLFDTTFVTVFDAIRGFGLIKFTATILF